MAGVKSHEVSIVVNGQSIPVPFLLAEATIGRKSFEVKKPCFTVKLWKILALLA